jgi:hypothetical protein
MLREAELEDILDLLILSKEFSKLNPLSLKFNMEKTQESFVNVITSDDSIVLVWEEDDSVVGFLTGVVITTAFSHDKVAVELAWFMNPEHRDGRKAARMLSKFESWAKEKGCKIVSVGDTESVTDLEKIYTRKGYSLLERTFTKEI